jgi:molecular chaperone IbpA
MGTFDFSPYRRSTIGFDRLFDMLETNNRFDTDGYPPFDLERVGEDDYRITLAVAGFKPSEVEIVAHQNVLTVSGRKADEQDDTRYLHRGIAARPFERRFQLADYIEVQSAQFDNGLLTISLRHVLPEAMKPRRIEIDDASARQEAIADREAA